MKILTILGSPRKRGNTAAVLSAFEDKIPAIVEKERITVIDLQIHGCRGCDACQKQEDAPGCSQGDDMGLILEKIMAADILVYAAPVYVWDFPAQMKALVDRQYCLVKWKGGRSTSLIRNKQAMLLATCGGNAEENADLIQTAFDREMDYLQCRVLGKFIIPHCTEPSKLGDRAGATAVRMIRTIQ